MFKLKDYFFMSADAGADAGGNGGNNQAGTESSGTLLGTGADAAAGATPGDWIPEQFRVLGDDGTLNVEGSARKLAESYSGLAKRVGDGNAAPENPEGYDPKVEVDGFNWEEFKADPEMQGFLKSAHAKGITNDQLSFILGEYQTRASSLIGGAAALDEQTAATELREAWKTDAEFKQNLGLAHRAFMSLADAGDQDRINEIGNNPMVIRMLAKIGKEMGEDTPIGINSPVGNEETIKGLMASEAYSNTKHADHARVKAQVDNFFRKTYGDAPVA